MLHDSSFLQGVRGSKTETAKKTVRSWDMLVVLQLPALSLTFPMPQHSSTPLFFFSKMPLLHSALKLDLSRGKVIENSLGQTK